MFRAAVLKSKKLGRDTVDTDEIKKVLADYQENTDQVFEHQDELDKIIQQIVLIEKKHLHQLETTSVSKRRRDVRQLIESNMPRAVGFKDGS